MADRQGGGGRERKRPGGSGGRGRPKRALWEPRESPFWAAWKEKVREEEALKRDEEEYAGEMERLRKDSQITFRISFMDRVKLKRIARGRRQKYQAYLREVLLREIRKEEAGSGGTAAGRGGAGAPA